MKKTKLLLAAAATAGLASIAFIGCGGEDETVACGDGGCIDAGLPASNDAATNTSFPISSSGCYTVRTLSNLTDGCGFEPGIGVGSTFPATYNRDTGVLSIGRERGSPGQPSLGAGLVTFNMGTLSRNNTEMEAGSTCTWNEVVSGTVTVTGTDAFTISYTDTQRTFSAGCTDVPTGGSCMSSWTWTLTKGTCPDGGI